MNKNVSHPRSSFAVYLSSIAALEDRALIERVTRLAARERRASAALVAHLAEMDSRRLHLKEGYSSLYAYCTEALHLSEQAAYNRIEAARAARRFPIILGRLADGSVHLTAIRLLSPILTEENHEALLEDARHKSRREVEEIAARIHPSPPVPSSVRRLPEPRPAASHPADSCAMGSLSLLPPVPTRAASGPPPPCPAAGPPGPPSPNPIVTYLPASISAAPASTGLSGAAPRPAVTPLAPGRYRVQFTASSEMHERLLHARALLRHRVPNGDVAVIFDLALQALIERVETRKFAKRKRPHAGAERSRPQAEVAKRHPPRAEPPGRPRTEAAERRRPETEEGEPKSTHRSTSCSRTGPLTRYIPADVRRAVWERDGGRCAYVSPSGRRCTETSFLEFDHGEPHACGGLATVENIRLRCRAHNGYEAEQRFGSEKMRARLSRPRARASWSGGDRGRLQARPRTSERMRNSSQDELRMKSQDWRGPG